MNALQSQMDQNDKIKEEYHKQAERALFDLKKEQQRCQQEKDHYEAETQLARQKEMEAVEKL